MSQEKLEILSKCCNASPEWESRQYAYICGKCGHLCETIERKEDDSVNSSNDNIARLTSPEISQTSEKVGAQGSVSDTPETDALDKTLQSDILQLVQNGTSLSKQVNHVIGNFYIHARTLERERDALKLSSEWLVAMLKVSRDQLVTRNGLDKDSDNRIAVQINKTLNAYQQLTQKEKKV